MRKIVLLLLVCMSFNSFSQTKIYDQQVKYKVTPDLPVIDFLYTKTTNSVLSQTSVSDFVSQITNDIPTLYSSDGTVPSNTAREVLFGGNSSLTFNNANSYNFNTGTTAVNIASGNIYTTVGSATLILNSFNTAISNGGSSFIATGTKLTLSSPSFAFSQSGFNNTNKFIKILDASGNIGFVDIPNYLGGDNISIDTSDPLNYVIDNKADITTAPASATDTGATGEIRYTSDFIYICVATNTWKRVAISTW